MNIIRLHDGRLVENWGEQDLAGLMQQLGAMPPPPADACRLGERPPLSSLQEGFGPHR